MEAKSRSFKGRAGLLLVLLVACLLLPAFVFTPSRTALAATTTGNPIIPGDGADPDIELFNGKYYIYPTTPDGSHFHAWASTDLSNWQDQGTILQLGSDVSWDNISGWAPTMVYRNNQYYFYFAGDGQIGVATCISPVGPCTDKGTPLVGSNGIGGIEVIDPMVFTDSDGQTYLYFGGSAGGGKMGIYKLNSDMVSLNGNLIVQTPPNFTEGVYMVKRNSTYYLMYSNARWYDTSYNVQYSTSTSPLGPWTYQGTVLSSANGNTGPGHHSLLKYPGTDDWYIVYHRHEQSNGPGRRIAIDRIYFNADGTIAPVVMTQSGVDVRPAPTGIPVYYEIVNKMSGKALDVPYETYQNNGSKIQQWTASNSQQQQWQLINVGDGYYKIVNHLSGKLLDIPYEAYTNNGTLIQQWQDAGAQQQLWQLVNTGGGYIEFMNSLSGKVLDVPYEGYSNNGTKIQQWQESGSQQQQWQLVKIN